MMMKLYCTLRTDLFELSQCRVKIGRFTEGIGSRKHKSLLVLFQYSKYFNAQRHGPCSGIYRTVYLQVSCVYLGLETRYRAFL